MLEIVERNLQAWHILYRLCGVRICVCVCDMKNMKAAYTQNAVANGSQTTTSRPPPPK